MTLYLALRQVSPPQVRYMAHYLAVQVVQAGGCLLIRTPMELHQNTSPAIFLEAGLLTNMSAVLVIMTDLKNVFFHRQDPEVVV